jgi:nucleoid-associated protein YgaU
MGLREKYSQAMHTANTVGMAGGAEERDGKLYIKGTTRTQAEANKIWDSIKTVADWPNEIVADIQATGVGAAPAPAAAGKTYTVKAGDTLSKIAKDELGNANAYTQIFDANRDQLDDPNKIKVGQVLKIPHATTH